MIDKWKRLNQKQKMALVEVVTVILLALILIIGCVVFLTGDKGGQEAVGSENSESVSSEDTSDDTVDDTSDEPETMTDIGAAETETTKETETTSELPSEIPSEIPSEQEPSSGNINEGNGADELTYGIDVSKYQGTIDWKQVADAGVDFAMIRVGNRTLKTGEIMEDNNAKYNMQEAAKYGIKVGVYFFSTAITKEEAIEEADWVSNYIAKYQITYPVAYNCERFDEAENRQYGLTKTQRTDFAIAFLDRIKEHGYSPMFYAGKNELDNEAKWETSRLESKYKIWVAQYPDKPYPETTASTYAGEHDMWQYTNKGKVSGIKGSVDMNIAYFDFQDTVGPQDSQAPGNVEVDPEALMNFEEVNESVTAKESTNLRDIPSQGEDSKVMYTLKNGEIATRTGISDAGWSRIVFHGKTYYAVSSLLTTDLEYQPPQDTESEIKTQFETVDELVTAKNEVNLRTIPSVTSEDSQIVVTLQHGDVVKRTGINEELGWSRVEYNGQVLYCVSSYLELVEE